MNLSVDQCNKNDNDLKKLSLILNLYDYKIKGVDFYQYNCGKFLSTNTIPDTESEVSVLDKIYNQVEQNLIGNKLIDPKISIKT